MVQTVLPNVAHVKIMHPVLPWVIAWMDVIRILFLHFALCLVAGLEYGEPLVLMFVESAKKERLVI
jgi:hypothetical protein